MERLSTVLGSEPDTTTPWMPPTDAEYYARVRMYGGLLFEDFCRETDQCVRCGGARYVVKRSRGMSVREGNDRVAPCGSCAAAERERRWEAIGIRARLTFGDWVETPDMQPALAKCRELIAGKCWCAFLSAQMGRGKTHLAVATVVEYVEVVRGSALFRSAPDLFAEMRDAYSPDNPHTLNDLVRRCETVDLLVIDDLGTEYHKPGGSGSDWVDEQLFRIIDARYQRKRRTLITSNLKPDSPTIPARIRSRLAAGAVLVTGGKDYRQKEAFTGPAPWAK